jgi:hypothetical protein
LSSSTASWRIGWCRPAGTTQAEPSPSAAVADHLRQGDKAEFGVAAGDELVGLGDVLALDELRLQASSSFSAVSTSTAAAP